MNPARIAIVDDDPLFADYLAKFLASLGYETLTHDSGTSLLAALSVREPIDAVLLDVLMPAMSGLETLRAIRSTHATLPVVMLSGQQVPATIVEAVRLGAVDYVVKSDDADALRAALETAIGQAAEHHAESDDKPRLNHRPSDTADASPVCWGSGPAMRRVMTMVDRVADSDVSVLLTGESGVGKEIVARELHRRSPRRLSPFVKVNCAALPAELLESELFGHERGAFTGAQLARVGKFEFADDGTLMLDEIGEMPVALQAKLLHVLQDRTFNKLGSNRPVASDVRVIAATNRDLAAMMRAGQFREDLYFRLQVIEIAVPPLRERQDEILPLSDFFLRRYAERYCRPVVPLSRSSRVALTEYSWPGNVRELENMMKRYVILRDESLLQAELQHRPLPEPAGVSHETESARLAATPVIEDGERTGATPGTGRLPEVARAAAMVAEREAIQSALHQFRWNRRKAAVLLGVSYKTFLHKMKECGINGPAGLDPSSL